MWVKFRSKMSQLILIVYITIWGGRGFNAAANLPAAEHRF